MPARDLYEEFAHWREGQMGWRGRWPRPLHLPQKKLVVFGSGGRTTGKTETALPMAPAVCCGGWK